MLFVLLADGSLQVCVVSGPAIATVASLPLPGLNPSAERLALHAWPHPVLPGGALLAVEAAKSGVTILEAPARWETSGGWRTGQLASNGSCPSRWGCRCDAAPQTVGCFIRGLPLTVGSHCICA